PASTGTASTTAGANTGIAAYADRGIIAALKSLVQDLGNSQLISSTDSSSSLSANTLSNLNSAFEKLIGDLGGSTSTSGGTSSTAGSQSTAALQSFLTGFLQDLQNNGTQSLSALGSSVNTTA
ncbi:MAG TPA: hypothetical protein VGE92_10080, partial [Steroidobacteraceae bacterium]